MSPFTCAKIAATSSWMVAQLAVVGVEPVSPDNAWIAS